MESFFGNVVTLVLLVFLQSVLGFDNLLYVSLESSRAPEDKQKIVRQVGIGYFLSDCLTFSPYSSH